MSRSLFGAALVLLPLAFGCSGSGANNDLGQAPADPLVRLGHYLDGYPALDLCVKGPDDSDFTGPIVRTKLMRSGGVPFAYTSNYISLRPAAYSVRVVTGASTDCSSSLFGVDIKTDAVEAGHRYTVAGTGNIQMGGSTLRLVLLEDDNGTDANQARVRFFHGVSSYAGGLDFGQGSGGNFSKQSTAPGYAQVGNVDGQPYMLLPAAENATYSVRPTSGGADLKTLLSKISLEKGQVYTATLTTYIGTNPDFSLSLCNDTGASQQGLLPCKELR